MPPSASPEPSLARTGRPGRGAPLLGLALCGVSAGAGCYNPAIENGGLRCSPDRACPSGFDCLADGRCWRSGTGGAPGDGPGGQEGGGNDAPAADAPCPPGRAHCTSSAGACETDITTVENCGGCGIACTSAGATCTRGADGAYRCAAGGCTGPASARCAGVCVNLANDVDHCGGCGNKCTVPQHGQPACRLGRCTATCDPGYHACAGSCANDESADTCGASCTPCPSPPHGTATCDGTRCGLACDDGYHACAGRCVNDYSPDGCGTACTPCATPAHGISVCDGTSCGALCDAGYEWVDGACVQPVCGKAGFTVSCATGNNCAANSSCLTGNKCQCNDGFTSVHCTGDACTTSSPCSSPDWRCAPEFCGAGRAPTACSDGATCAANSTCAGDGTCRCDLGFKAVLCDGTPCTKDKPCVSPGWRCAPAGCGRGIVFCSGGGYCPAGSRCSADGKSCACSNTNLCDGTPCTGSACTPDWYCAD